MTKSRRTIRLIPPAQHFDDDFSRAFVTLAKVY